MRFSLFFALVSVTTMAVVAFGIGFACGRWAGVECARQLISDRCLEWARLALHGHREWRDLSPARVLQRVAERLGPNPGGQS